MKYCDIFFPMSVLLLLVENCRPCDIKLIRELFQEACGRKKRYHIGQNAMPIFLRMGLNSLGRPKPRIFDSRIVNAMLGIDGSEISSFTSTASATQTTTTTLTPTTKTTLTPTTTTTMPFASLNGMHSFLLMPEFEGHIPRRIVKREVNEVLEKCCRVPPIGCTAEAFIGAC